MRFNRSDLLKYVESANYNPTIKAKAKEIAGYYRAVCKTHSAWMEPYKTTIPVEQQKVFKHFIKAAELVSSIEAHEDVNLRDFVQAQFAGLAWTNRVPYISQLYTPAAIVRYHEYISKKCVKAAKQLQQDDLQDDIYDFEERKASRIAEQLGVSTRRALRMVPHEFSPGFLRKYNVVHPVNE